METNAWSLGPRIPDYIENQNDFSVVKFGDSFLLIGAKIHEYSQELDEWVERPEKPKYPTGRVVIDVAANEMLGK